MHPVTGPLNLDLGGNDEAPCTVKGEEDAFAGRPDPIEGGPFHAFFVLCSTHLQR